MHKPACTERTYHVSAGDLPISCPTSDMMLWNGHPKVYLAFKDGKAQCEYCSAIYMLDDAHSKSH